MDAEMVQLLRPLEETTPQEDEDEEGVRMEKAVEWTPSR
jgi:hypothetical protein